MWEEREMPKTIEELIAEIEDLMEKYHLPGMMLTIVSKDSVLWSGGLGWADLEAQEAVDEHTLFRMGSITKTIASLAIQKLAAEGHFHLEDKLSVVAPEVAFKNKWEKTHPVKIVHLLEHSAGFDDMHVHAMFNKGNKEASTLDMIQIHKKSLSTKWKPGTRFAYSNPGYVILTYLVEKYSGMSYHEYIEKEIFQPLGMTESDVAAYPIEGKSYAKGYGYRFEDEAYVPIPRYAIHGGLAGNLHANARDMGKLIQFFLRSGKTEHGMFIPGFQLHRMERPRSTLAAKAGLELMYGLGLYGNLAYSDGRFPFYGHDGGIFGFVSSFAYHQQLDVGFAISNNGQALHAPIASLIGRYFSSKLITPDPRTIPLKHSQVAPFLGYYRTNNSRHKLYSFLEPLVGGFELTFENETLYIESSLGVKTPLRHVGQRKFLAFSDHYPMIALVKDDTGEPKVVLAGGAVYAEKRHRNLDYFMRIGFLWGILLPPLLVLLAFIWIPFSIFRWFSVATWKARLIPVIAGVAEYGMLYLFLLAIGNPLKSGQINELSIGYLLVSCLFALLAIWSPIQLIRNWDKIRSHVMACILFLSSLIFSFMALYFWYYGLIGLRFWSY